MQQHYITDITGKYLTCIIYLYLSMSIYVSIYLYIISTTPPRLLHHTTPPHSPSPPGWRNTDLARGVQWANGHGEGADCGGVRHQSCYQGKADDGSWIDARLSLLWCAGRLTTLVQTHGGRDTSHTSACSECVSFSSLTNTYIVLLCNCNIPRKILHFHYVCLYIYI